MSDKSLTDRWWDTFNAALTGVLAYPGCAGEFEWNEDKSKDGNRVNIAKEIANRTHGSIMDKLPGEE